MPASDPLLLDLMGLSRALTPEERRRLHNQGRRGPRSKARPTALPGPEGETCGTCSNLDYHETRPGRRFYKCKLVLQTHGPATDVRKSDPACERWGKTLDGRKPVTAQWLWEHPDTRAYMFIEDRDEVGLDPWVEITGVDCRTDGSGIILEYGRTGEKIVNPTFTVFVQ